MMTSPDEFAIPHTILRHFDLASTPWTESVASEIDSRRQKLPGNQLFFDRLLAFAELQGSSLYPPRTPAALRRLLHAVYTSPPDRLKRDCFFYYLLKDYDHQTSSSTKKVNGNGNANGHVGEPSMDVDGEDIFVETVEAVAGAERANEFAKKRCMPGTWKVFIDGYWALDHGLWDLAISSLSDPSITEINFNSEILHTLANHASPPSHACKLVNSFISSTHPDLHNPTDSDIRLIALASAATLSQAFTFIRSRGIEDQSRMREAVWAWALGAPRTPCGAGPHGVQSQTLKELLHLPLTNDEDKHLINFLSHPPRSISPPALSLLHDLVTLRLIHQGQYQHSLQLDRQLAGSGGREEDRQRRREMVREFIAILPEAHRRALMMDVEALAKRDESHMLQINGHGEDVDMASSWVQVPSASVSTPTPVPPPIAAEPQAPTFAAVAAPEPTTTPSTIPQSSSSNSLFGLARVSTRPASPAPTPTAKNSPFAGPPRFATGTPVAPSPRRVLSGSPFNLPPSTAAARANHSQTPVPLPKAPKQIINDDDDDDEEEDGSVLGRRLTRGKGKGRALRELSHARDDQSSIAEKKNDHDHRQTESRPTHTPAQPSSILRRSTRRHVSGTSQADPEADKEKTPSPPSPPCKRSGPVRATRQSTAPPSTMPGSFDQAEPTIDEEMPPPPASTSKSNGPARATSAVPESVRSRSRYTRSASRAILDEDENESGPPFKKPKSTTGTGTSTATRSGKGRGRRTSVAAGEVTETDDTHTGAGVRRSTRRGTTQSQQQQSEQGSPTPSVRSDVSRRRTIKEGSATPRMTRSRK